MGFMALVFIIIIAVPVALISVKKENSFLDRLVNLLSTISISAPSFFLGLLFIWIFGIILKRFSPGRYIPFQQDFAGFINYLIYPALALAIPHAAMVVKFLRGSLFQQLQSDYVRTARSKGNPEIRVLYCHVLKNAIIPAVTLLAMMIGEILAGSVVIEQVFTIPGIGRLFLSAITSRDFNLLQTLTVYIAFCVVIANTLGDIAIHIIDPRIQTR
jgi:ABC-type dipeptide/oligopeptide/nickel transport system permease component